MRTRQYTPKVSTQNASNERYSAYALKCADKAEFDRIASLISLAGLWLNTDVRDLTVCTRLPAHMDTAKSRQLQIARENAEYRQEIAESYR